MTEREALKLALEALRYSFPADGSKHEAELEEKHRKAITAIKEVLAQPEQEPVVHTLNCVCGAVWDIKANESEEMVHTPNTTPPQRKPLTDEEIDEIYFKSSLEVDNRCEDIYDFVRAIEAKLKEKNT